MYGVKWPPKNISEPGIGCIKLKENFMLTYRHINQMQAVRLRKRFLVDMAWSN